MNNEDAVIFLFILILVFISSVSIWRLIVKNFSPQNHTVGNKILAHFIGITSGCFAGFIILAIATMPAAMSEEEKSSSGILSLLFTLLVAAGLTWLVFVRKGKMAPPLANETPQNTDPRISADIERLSASLRGASKNTASRGGIENRDQLPPSSPPLPSPNPKKRRPRRRRKTVKGSSLDTINFSYIAADGHETTRSVIVKKVTDIHFEGFCLLAQDIRTFRLENVLGSIVSERTGEFFGDPEAWADQVSSEYSNL